MIELKHNIFMNGVGGQGIGLLSETLMRAYDRLGYYVQGVDTHGLAQRGGGVESHLRVGISDGSPLVEKGCADLVLSLERTEALRALNRNIKYGGVLVFYDTLWQPLSDRLGVTLPVTLEDLYSAGRSLGVTVLRVSHELTDVRMQNIALLGSAYHGGFLPQMKMECLEAGLEDLMTGDKYDNNLSVLRAAKGELIK